MKKFVEIVIMKKFGSNMNDSLSKCLHFILLCFEGIIQRLQLFLTFALNFETKWKD